jgi:tryptophan 2,3-dioxygenase
MTQFSEQTLELLRQLQEHLAKDNQNIDTFLEGYRYNTYLSYWDYIELDTLLSLQKPRTTFPDEHIFIMYHQITELYFKLCLHEYRQLREQHTAGILTGDFLQARVGRITSYFDALIMSFRIMREGMEREQFMRYRISLTPASGFQSAQYRFIEICSTDFTNLVTESFRDEYRSKSLQEQTQMAYWRFGATNADGTPSLTLRQFLDKYSDAFHGLAAENVETNIAALYRNLPEQEKTESLKVILRKLDRNVNVNWKLQHLHSAAHYLTGKSVQNNTAATGGTNWGKYLPPHFQFITFFPELWTADELKNWGKQWDNSASNLNRDSSMKSSY